MGQTVKVVANYRNNKDKLQRIVIGKDLKQGNMNQAQRQALTQAWVDRGINDRSINEATMFYEQI